MARDVKTKPTPVGVDDFLAGLADPVQATDAKALAAMFAEVTGEPAVMWGPAIVGFGRYAYVYDSGRSGEMARLSFSPRKANLTLYVLPGQQGYDHLLNKLGKHKTSGGCLHIKRLADVDGAVLREILKAALAYMDTKHPPQ
jgi:hypothetical protein